MMWNGREKNCVTLLHFFKKSSERCRWMMRADAMPLLSCTFTFTSQRYNSPCIQHTIWHASNWHRTVWHRLWPRFYYRRICTMWLTWSLLLRSKKKKRLYIWTELMSVLVLSSKTCIVWFSKDEKRLFAFKTCMTGLHVSQTSLWMKIADNLQVLIMLMI